MKHLLVLMPALCSLWCAAQDTTYYNADNDTVATLAEAERYMVTYPDAQDPTLVMNEHFNKEGQRTGVYRGFPQPEGKWISHGLTQLWNPTCDRLWYEANYEHGKLNGALRTWWPNGAPKRYDMYAMDSLITGAFTDSLGVQQKWYPYESSAAFPDGQKGLVEYLQKNVSYPRKARNNGVQGRVFVRFVVMKDGTLSDVDVVEPVHPLLDAEAIRVVQAMPKWEPARMDGIPVKMKFTQPILFNLE